VQDMALNAKKEALQELIKMMQDLMVKMDGKESSEPEEMGEEGEECEKEGMMTAGNEVQNGEPKLEDLVKSEMKRGGKITPPKSAMLAVSMKASAPKKSSMKRYG